MHGLFLKSCAMMRLTTRIDHWTLPVAVRKALMSVAIVLALSTVALGSGVAGSKSVTIENDIGSSDRHYTNGIRFHSMTRIEPSTDQRGSFWTFPFRTWNIFDRRRASEANFLGYAVGQNFYTPEDIESTELQIDDRPFAAILYYGWLRRRIEDRRVMTTELDLGLVGPMALGESVQRGWHEIIKARTPNGWHNQIRTLPLLQWRALVQWQAFELGFKDLKQSAPIALVLDPFVMATAGSSMLSSEAGLGLLIGSRIERKLGRIPSPFTPETIPKSCFWQLGARARYVYRPWSVFIDGTPSWRYERSHHVEGIDDFYEWEASLVLGYRTRVITLTRVQRGREFVGADSKVHRFWSASYGWTWD